jgi:hypothetical protein
MTAPYVSWRRPSRSESKRRADYYGTMYYLHIGESVFEWDGISLEWVKRNYTAGSGCGMKLVDLPPLLKDAAVRMGIH